MSWKNPPWTRLTPPPEDHPEFGQWRRTPPWLVKLLEKEVVKRKFKLDAAAAPCNAVVKRYFTIKDNGLEQNWRTATFINPGFNKFRLWIKKAVEEGHQRHVVSCLIGPKACSQDWYHDWATQGTIYHPTKRIVYLHPKTGNPTGGAREDSMVVVVGPGFWNRGWSRGEILVRRLNVTGMVVTS